MEIYRPWVCVTWSASISLTRKCRRRRRCSCCYKAARLCRDWCPLVTRNKQRNNRQRALFVDVEWARRSHRPGHRLKDRQTDRQTGRQAERLSPGRVISHRGQFCHGCLHARPLQSSQTRGSWSAKWSSLVFYVDARRSSPIAPRRRRRRVDGSLALRHVQLVVINRSQSVAPPVTQSFASIHLIRDTSAWFFQSAVVVFVAQPLINLHGSIPYSLFNGRRRWRETAERLRRDCCIRTR